MFDIKIFLYALPVLAALLYGLNYAIYGHLLKTLSIPTLMIMGGLSAVFMASLYSYFANIPISLSPAFKNPNLLILFMLAIICSQLAWTITLSMMKHVSPTYAAIGEVAYPIFVPIFAYLLFKDKQFDMATLVGGLFIFIGLFVMIYFKSHKAP